MEDVSLEESKSINKNNQFKVRCWRRGIPLWLVIFIWTIVPLIVVAIGITAIIYTEGQSQVNTMYQQLHTNIQNSIHTYFSEYFASMKMTGESIQKLEPHWITETMPIEGGYDPTIMIGLMNTFDTNEFALESLGLSTRNVNGSKVSWEMARGFGCPQYIYAYVDDSTRPAFLGYCASVNDAINKTSPAYKGIDWGFKPTELAILAGNITATFEPIFALLNKFTLTYLIGKNSTNNPGQVYGFSFTEKNLQLIDDFFSSLQIGETGVGYVVERQTGLIVTASVSGQTTFEDSNGNVQRVHALNATNSLISSSAEILLNEFASQNAPYSFANLNGRQNLQESGLLINTDQFEDTGLDWLIILVIPQSDFFSKIQTSSTVSIGLAAAVIVVGLVLTFFWTRLITRPLGVIKANMEKIALMQFNEMEAPQESSLAEIRDIQQSYSQLQEGLKRFSQSQ